MSELKIATYRYTGTELEPVVETPSSHKIIEDEQLGPGLALGRGVKN